jgi:hypothetical protein
MSPPDKPDHARGWLYIEKLLGEEEEERIKGLTEAELRAELKPAGPDSGEEWDADELMAMAEAELAKKAPPAVLAAPDAPPPALAPPAPAPPETPSPEKVAKVIPIRRPWATALGLLVATFFIVCIFKMSIGPDPVATAPTDRQIAEGDRDLALASCALKEWAACKRYLDEAARLDPKGESEPRVVTARGEIANAAAAEAGVAPR